MLNVILISGVIMISIFGPKNYLSKTVPYQLDNIISVNFPLRGIWIAPNTPGTKIPSHGTSNFGESYAIDFVMIQDNDSFKKPYKKSFFRYIFQGLALSDFYGWGQTIYSPIDGKVVSVVDSVKERNPVRILSDIVNTIKATNDYTQKNGLPELVAGNYVLIKYHEGVYVLLAHMKKGSIVVKPGQNVHANQPLGELGHSGNSTMPHLHMQLMDSQDFKIAQGVPFVFKKYEVKRNSRWETINNSIPTVNDVIKY